jgi:hypothetical protein
LSEVAVRKCILVALLILPSPALGAGTLDRAGVGGTRQSAIWQGLFDPVRDDSPDCQTRIRWLPEPLKELAPALATGASPFALAAAVVASEAPTAGDQSPSTPPRPKAFEYSEAYNRRRKIHFYASFATLPLFVTQYILGDKLYDGSSGSTRDAHSAAAVGIEALFAVNTVTGVWNMWESRKDPNGRTKRFIHGFTMLGADVGFVATGLLAPDSEDGHGDKSTHRNVAIASMAVATASYLIMLIGR